MQVREGEVQKKLAITDRGLVFLDKWVELQKMMQTKNTRKLKAPSPQTQVLTVSSK